MFQLRSYLIIVLPKKPRSNLNEASLCYERIFMMSILRLHFPIDKGNLLCYNLNVTNVSHRIGESYENEKQ